MSSTELTELDLKGRFNRVIVSLGNPVTFRLICFVPQYLKTDSFPSIPIIFVYVYLFFGRSCKLVKKDSLRVLTATNFSFDYVPFVQKKDRSVFLISLCKIVYKPEMGSTNLVFESHIRDL